MHELERWVSNQGRREAGVVRLEDALLGGRWVRYFAHRLRFFVARGVVSTLIHALKVVLLLGAFPPGEFLAIIVIQAALAISGDAWWGALEALRGRIRQLRRRGKSHLAYREIGGWLRLSVALTAVGVAASGVWLLLAVVLDGGLSAAELYVAFLGAGAALDLTARAYHSGAYALRRVYRPLPSLLAVDVISVSLLVGLWPVVGIWAFPIAEVVSGVAVVALSIRYTSRSYRGLALPTLVPLLRQTLPMPSRATLRSAVLPAVAYGFVGVEALVVIAALTLPGDAASTALVAMLAGLGPIVRAGFEWARLLYFDFKRLEVPILAGMRRRFERAVSWLAVLMGFGTWLVAALVGVAVLGLRQVDVVLALAPLFAVRSLLAAAQMRAFTRGGYRRLAIVGAAGVCGLAGVLAGLGGPADAGARVLAVSAVLGISLLLLRSLPEPRDPADAVSSYPDWLGRLRRVGGPVTVTTVTFDDRVSARGVTEEARRSESWRRRMVAGRLGRSVAARGGTVAWSSRTELRAFYPAGVRTALDAAIVARYGGGLVRRVQSVLHPAGPKAASAVVSTDASVASGGIGIVPDEASVLAEFRRRFPRGVAFDPAGPVVDAMATMSSADRAAVHRAALVFCRDLGASRWPKRTDVTALAVGGELRLIFLVDRREDPAARRAWQKAIRAWTLAAAAGGTSAATGARAATEARAAAPQADQPLGSATPEGGLGASEAGML
jgi:hypothetical protein